MADGGVTEDVVTAGAAAPDGGPPSTSAPTPSTRAAPSADEAGFRAWAAHRMPVLRRRAFLLCGDLHTADDLVQETLVRVYARWHRVAGGPDDPQVRALMAERLEGVFERTAKSMGEPDGKTDAAVAAWSTMLGGLLLARVFGPGARGDEILAIARQAALAQEPPRDAG